SAAFGERAGENSRARNESAAPLSGNLDADQSALERNVGTVPIDIGIVRGEALLGPSQCIFGALHIDLFGALSGFCKDRHAIRKNLGESANNSERRRHLATETVIAEFTDAQFGDERRVPREDAEIAVLPRKLRFHDFLAEQLLLRSDDDQLDGVGQHFYLTRSPSFFQPSRGLPRSCQPCRTPAPEHRRTSLPRFP